MQQSKQKEMVNRKYIFAGIQFQETFRQSKKEHQQQRNNRFSSFYFSSKS